MKKGAQGTIVWHVYTKLQHSCARQYIPVKQSQTSERWHVYNTKYIVFLALCPSMCCIAPLNYLNVVFQTREKCAFRCGNEQVVNEPT